MVECAQRLSGQLAERSSERQTSGTIGEQIVDVFVWQTVEQATEVPEVSGRNRTLQSTVERFLGVPVPQTVPRDEIQRWTEEHISDIPVPQAVEGLVEAPQVAGR